MKGMLKVNDWGGRVFDSFAGIAVFALMAIIILQVVMRTVFSAGLPWSIEISTYVFIFLTLIGGIVHVSNESLLMLDLTQLLQGKLGTFQLITTIVSRLSNMVVPAVLGIAAVKWWIAAKQLPLPATGLPQRYVITVIMCAFFVMALTQFLTLFAPQKHITSAL